MFFKSCDALFPKAETNLGEERIDDCLSGYI